MTTTTLTKITLSNNSDIDIMHTSNDAYIKMSITAGYKSWSDLTMILTRLFGESISNKIVVRILSQMGTVIAMDGKGSSSTRIYIEGHGGAHIDVSVFRTCVSINAHGFQIKPITA